MQNSRDARCTKHEICRKHGAVCKGCKVQGAENNGYSGGGIACRHIPQSFVGAFEIEVPFDRHVFDTQAA